MSVSTVIASKFKAVDKLSGPVNKMAAKTEKFSTTAKRGFAKAERSARKFRSTVSSVNSKLFNMRNASGFLAAGAAVRGVQKLTDQTATYTDNLAKNARFLDMEISQLQGYRFAAERAGVSTQKMDKAFESVGKRVGELQKDTGSLYTFLEKRGDTALISQLKNAKNTDEAMKLLADKYQSLETQTAKAGFASKAFSKTNMEVAKVMENGSEGLQEMIDRQQKFGPSVEKSSKAAEKYKDVQTNMNLALKSLKVLIGTELIPGVSSMMENTSEWIAANKALIKTKVEKWVGRFTQFMKGAKVVGMAMFQTMRTGIGVIWGIVSGLTMVLSPIGKLINFFSSAESKSEAWNGKLRALGTILGIVGTGIIAMNVASKAMLLLQGSLRVATAATTAAQWAYHFAVGAVTAIQGKQAIALRTSRAALIGYKAVTYVAAAAQWAWNAAMNANPIGLIITGVAALIGLITAVIAKWDSWGAAVTVFMGPLGMVISLIQSFRRNWDMVVKAFQTGGIVAGLKAIGVTILDALLMPVQQLLELVGKLPSWLGGGLASDAASGIESLRKKIRGLGDDVKEMGEKAKGEGSEGPQEQQKMPNSRTSQTQTFNRSVEEQVQKLDININDPAGRTTVRQDNKGKKKTGVKLTKNQGAFANDKG